MSVCRTVCFFAIVKKSFCIRQKSADFGTDAAEVGLRDAEKRGDDAQWHTQRDAWKIGNQLPVFVGGILVLPADEQFFRLDAGTLGIPASPVGDVDVGGIQFFEPGQVEFIQDAVLQQFDAGIFAQASKQRLHGEYDVTILAKPECHVLAILCRVGTHQPFFKEVGFAPLDIFPEEMEMFWVIRLIDELHQSVE